MTFSRKMYNCCLGLLLLWIFPHVFIALCLKWSHKSSFNQNKPHQFVLRLSVLSKQSNVWPNMADCLHISWHLSLFCFTRSLIVKGLPMWGFSCETCFWQLFGQFGTEFLCLANSTFRLIMLMIWSFAAVCFAYKWIYLHLVRV